MFGRVRQFINNVSIIIRSIRFRLALWFVLILGVVMAIFCAFIFTRQAQDLQIAELGASCALLASHFSTNRPHAFLSIQTVVKLSSKGMTCWLF
jgi:hypothetical protein